MLIILSNYLFVYILQVKYFILFYYLCICFFILNKKLAFIVIFENDYFEELITIFDMKKSIVININSY